MPPSKPTRSMRRARRAVSRVTCMGNAREASSQDALPPRVTRLCFSKSDGRTGRTLCRPGFAVGALRRQARALTEVQIRASSRDREARSRDRGRLLSRRGRLDEDVAAQDQARDKHVREAKAVSARDLAEFAQQNIKDYSPDGRAQRALLLLEDQAAARIVGAALNARESLASIVRSACGCTLARLRTRSGASPYSCFNRPNACSRAARPQRSSRYRFVSRGMSGFRRSALTHTLLGLHSPVGNATWLHCA